MAAYLQLGHDSWNLLDDEIIGPFAGVVLSPVNHGPAEVVDRLKPLISEDGAFESILDPQMYNPSANKGRLAEWKYYPDDFETADRSELAWWVERGKAVVSEAVELDVNSICTPAYMDRSYTDEYYKFIVEIGDQILPFANGKNIGTLLTIIVNLDDLAQPDRALQIASVVSGSECHRIYLMFLDERLPQKEPFRDAAELASAAHLVRMLSQHFRVHVAFCAHDLVMWKWAGATDVSSGKFMNLRRFSPSRWQQEEVQGRVVPYWSQNFLSLIRDQDVLRLNRDGFFDGQPFLDNPASLQILEILKEGQGRAWLALSWRQYLRWVINSERICEIPKEAESLLENCAQEWQKIHQKRIRFVDFNSDGTHVNIWISAINEAAGRS